jgi:membrane associated rhomboid family serine protease
MAWDNREYYRDEPPRIRMAIPMPGKLTLAIMAANFLVFLLLNVFRLVEIADFAVLDFRGGSAFRHPWQFVTYAYLHGGGSHLFWNMLGLYFFLTPLEEVWGWRKTLGFYTLGTVAAALTFGVMCIFYPFAGLMGASGGVLAALGACAYLFPQMMIFMVIPIRVAAALLAVLYLLTIAGDRNPSDAAHLGGLVFGFFGPYYGGHFVRDSLRKWETRRQQAEEVSQEREQETIDRILQKVHDSGMNSLSRAEKKALARATERQRKSDQAREARYRQSTR